jgi:putative NIF3 family GTP cyclohydrolase 1 type 2
MPRAAPESHAEDVIGSALSVSVATRFNMTLVVSITGARVDDGLDVGVQQSRAGVRRVALIAGAGEAYISQCGHERRRSC